MARINNILAEQTNHVSFCFGRLNPPHYGHEGVIKTVQSSAKEGNWAIFVSKTHEPRKNPLTYEQKVRWIYALYPQTQGHLVEDPNIKTVLQAAAYLYGQGYRSATFVAGEDDMPQMRKLLEDYNGAEGKGHGYYQFEPMTFVESPRLTSATNARQAAQDNNPEAFELATRVKSDIMVDGKTLFQAVRAGMGLGLTESIVGKQRPDMMQIFDDFLPVVMKVLKLDKLPTIKLSPSVTKSKSPTFGRYVNNEHTIYLGIDQRHPLDIIRTLAHELVHFKQHLLGKLNGNSGDTGSPEENQAHALAGVVMRHFNEKYPHYFQDAAMSLEENFKDHKGPGRPGDAKRHGVPTKASVSTLRKVAKQGGRKGQLAHWMANMKAGRKKASESEVTAGALDKDTPTVAELMAKYNVSLSRIEQELRRGIKVELEHTSDVSVASEIARDHLNEKLDYYTELAQVEKTEANMQPGNSVPSDRAVAINPFDYYTPFMNEELQLDEVSLKKVRSFASDPFLDQVNLAWELELIWPDHDDGSHDDDDYQQDSEPDYDADEGINTNNIGSFRRDIENFFAGDHNSRREVRNVLDDFLSTYHDYLAEKWDELYDEEDEETRDEVTNRIEAGTDEVTAKAEAKDEWISNNEDEMLEDFVENVADAGSMSSFMQYTGDLNWPVWTESESNYESKGSLTRDDLRSMFIREFGDMLRQDGFKVIAWDTPTRTKEPDTWYFEPDGSLSADDRTDGGVEITSPIIPYKRSLEYLDKIFAWAKKNDAYTSAANSTGMHLNLSLPEPEMDQVDWVKLILLGGDDRVLRDFDRWSRGEFTWAKSALKYLKQNAQKGMDLDIDMVIKAVRDGLTPEARKEAERMVQGGKYMSVHPKGETDAGNFKWVEFRSAGGDTLNELPKLKTAALQYARSLYIASNPEVEKKEYASKLFSLLGNIKSAEPGLRALQQFAAGKIDKETLKYTLAKAAISRGQKPKYQPTGKMYVFAAGGSAKDKAEPIEIIAPTLLSAIPKAIAAANERRISSFYFKLVTDPTERVFSVETEDRLEGTDRRAGMLVVAQDGGQAAQLVSDMLGLPVNVLQAVDRTNAYDLDDMNRWIQNKWTTKEQIETVQQEIQRAAAPATTGEPATASGEPRSVFQREPQPQAAPSTDGPGTYIVRYLPPQGNEQQTAYDANDYHDAVEMFTAQHPVSYRIISVEKHDETPANESLSESLLAEVNMGAGALADFAKSDMGKSIRVGFEAEMLVPDMSESDPEPQWDDDLEPNWDENRSIRFTRNWRTQIQDFWRDGDYNSESRRDIERAIEEMDEQYQEYVGEEFADYLDSEEGIAALMASIRENEAGTADLSDEEIMALDDYANYQESATDDVRDRWSSEYMSNDRNFINWANSNSLDDMVGFANRFNLSWPYMNRVSSGGSGSMSMSDLAKEFTKYSGYESDSGSYSTSPDDTTSIFKPDSSIKRLGLPDNYSGVEFASAFRPLPETMDMLQKFYKWAGQIGAEANQSTGFHMGVSIPQHTRDTVDVMKFILFLGDEKVLADFGRQASSWCSSSLAKIRSNTNETRVKEALAEFRKGLDTEAAKMMRRRLLPTGDRYVSVNYKDDYIEIRSGGGNFFDQKDLIVNTMLRYVRVLGLAANPEEAKQEYAKKLYKVLSKNLRNETPDTIQYFAQYAAGTLPSTALKSFVRQTQSQRERDREIKAATAPATGLHGAGKWEIYKVLRRADDFEVHEFLAPNADQAQHKFEQWARISRIDPEDYTVVKANRQPNQQSQDDDIDFGTWEPEPEPQRPTDPNAWSPSARIAYQLVDRTGNPIAYFTDGTRMTSNSLFYAPNSDEAGRRAAELDRVHGLPMGYIVRPFNGPGGSGGGGGTPVRLQGFNRVHESLFKSNIARALFVEHQEVLDEVVMNPSAFRAFLGTEAAAKMTMGFEAEMCVKNLDTSSTSRITPRMPAEEEMEIPYPYDTAGRAKYYEFWGQNNANARRAITYGLKRLEARMKTWMDGHARGEEITSDHWARFLRGGGYRNWTNMYQLNNILELEWPYGNETGGRFNKEQLKQDFQNSTGFGAVIFNSYHGGNKPNDKFVFEPDSSIRPKAGDGAQELVSFAMPLPQAIDALDKMFAWANEKGYVYTNASTGFHVNVGMGENTPEKIDQLKLLLLLGDQQLLKDFDREANTYCESMMGRLNNVLRRTDQSNIDQLLNTMKSKTWDGLRQLASRFVDRAQRGDKFVSVNNKGKYIEFRGAGGDWMSQQDKLRNTILQVSRAYAMAADPVEGQQDYLKKAYKLLSGMGESKKDDRLQVFVDWAMGKINQDQLRSQLQSRQGRPATQRQQAAPAGSSNSMVTGVSDAEIRGVLDQLPDDMTAEQTWRLYDANANIIWQQDMSADYAVRNAARAAARTSYSEGSYHYLQRADVPDSDPFAEFNDGQITWGDDVQAAITNRSNTTQAAPSTSINTGEYSDSILAALPREMTMAQSWSLIDQDGDEVNNFTGTAQEAVSYAQDISESNPEYTFSLEDRDGSTFAMFSSGGRVAYGDQVLQAARANGWSAGQTARQPAAQAGMNVINDVDYDYLNPRRESRSGWTFYHVDRNRPGGTVSVNPILRPHGYDALGEFLERFSNRMPIFMFPGVPSPINPNADQLRTAMDVAARANGVPAPAAAAPTAQATDDEEEQRFDVTYRGRNNQVYVTVIDANDAEDARQQFRANRPNAQIVYVLPHRTDMDESVTLDEVTQNPTVWDNFLASPAANSVVMGFEAEMCVKGLSDRAEVPREQDRPFGISSQRGKADFVAFWTQNDANTPEEVKATITSIKEWFRGHPWSREDVTRMSQVYNMIARRWIRALKWPYPLPEQYTRSHFAKDFAGATGYKISVGDSATKDSFGLVDDGSIEAKQGDGGVELISYPMPLPEAMAAMNKTFEFAKAGRRVYTNTSTGFHINVSLAGKSLKNIDQLKLLLLMGDNAVLAEFGRKTNEYCASMLKRLQDVTKAAATGNNRHLDKYDDWGQGGIGNIEPYFQKILPQMRSQTWAGLKKIANDIMTEVHYDDKYVTVNLHDQYIEFRGAGGNWLNKWDSIYYTVLRVTHAYTLAADPNAGQQDYLKKLYKVMTAYNAGNDQLKLWTDFTLGTVSAEQLKQKLTAKHAAARQIGPSQPRPNYVLMYYTRAMNEKELVRFYAANEAEAQKWITKFVAANPRVRNLDYYFTNLKEDAVAAGKLIDILIAEESKRKPKKPKTIIDGAMKTLIAKGRSEDEAIADLKKEIDKKFYTEDNQIVENFEKTDKGWKHAGHFGRPVTYQPLPRWNNFDSQHRHPQGTADDISHYMSFLTQMHGWHIDDLTGDEIADTMCKMAGTNPQQELKKFIEINKKSNPDFPDFTSWSQIFDAWKKSYKDRAMTAYGGGKPK